MKNILVIFSMLICLLQNAHAQQTSILYIGNSYIYTENTPAVLYNLALAGGDSIYHESNTPGGYTFEQHSTNATTLNKISSRDWDFVILQEQSQKPSFPPAQVASETYPFASILVDSIKSNYECSEPVFFMTWGRRDGDQQNCQFYPPLCTFAGMNARLRESYLEMGFDNESTVAPCGAAWHNMAINNNFFWNGLYSGDGSHPSAWGAYLNACVFYATIFRKSPVGIPYYYTIGATDGATLQQLAEDIVLDSLSSWYIGHADVTAEASSTPVNAGTTWEFNNSSTNATSHFWDFNDNNTSSDPNPTYTFSGPGPHNVMYIASSNCDADTVYLTPTFLSLGDDVFSRAIQIVRDGDQVIMTNNSDASFELAILDLGGKLLNSAMLRSRSKLDVTGSLIGGMNLIRLSGEGQQRTFKLLQ